MITLFVEDIVEACLHKGKYMIRIIFYGHLLESECSDIYFLRVPLPKEQVGVKNAVFASVS